MVACTQELGCALMVGGGGAVRYISGLKHAPILILLRRLLLLRALPGLAHVIYCTPPRSIICLRFGKRGGRHCQGRGGLLPCRLHIANCWSRACRRLMLCCQLRVSSLQEHWINVRVNLFGAMPCWRMKFTKYTAYWF